MYDNCQDELNAILSNSTTRYTATWSKTGTKFAPSNKSIDREYTEMLDNRTKVNSNKGTTILSTRRVRLDKKHMSDNTSTFEIQLNRPNTKKKPTTIAHVVDKSGTLDHVKDMALIKDLLMFSRRYAVTPQISLKLSIA